VPRLCGFYPGICLTTEEKARKNFSQGSHTFSIEILSQIFLIIRGNERDIIKNVIGLCVKCPLFLSDFNEI